MEKPAFRKLRGYAFDPSLSSKLDTYEINEVVYKVPWEELQIKGEALIGEYLEIIDYDPSTGKYYKVVDLDNPYLLAQDGLSPSESNPMFHQQMVYAVAMTTIKNFEFALGRKVQWAARRLPKGSAKYEEYIQRLRIYPHALREANAYYSPEKKSLLFGYFYSNPADEQDQMPGSLVFTCLSHDIIAHEVTHAILDGLKKNYGHPTNPDVWAFHEAFADIVALFQHFSFPKVLRHQIAKNRGKLSDDNLLAQLAQEFGVGIGHYGSLRNAIGDVDKSSGKWKRRVPNPNDYQERKEPHARGSILVDAVFDAFLMIYNRRIQDLMRIASGGTGVLPDGEIHPDLVDRLAKEASKTATQILHMCIRAIDYCPPVDITFGHFLRAIITADMDIVSEDRFGYRLAFIDAFKRRGIFPAGIKSLSVESLKYPVSDIDISTHDLFQIVADFLKDYSRWVAYETNRELIYKITQAAITGDVQGLESDFFARHNIKVLGLHERMTIKFQNDKGFAELTGLTFLDNWERFGVRTSSYVNSPSFQINGLKLVSRVSPNGDKVNQVFFSMVQRSGVLMSKEGTIQGHFVPSSDDSIEENQMIFRGGTTLVLDLDSRKLKYIIAKPIVLFTSKDGFKINSVAIERQWDYQTKELAAQVGSFAQYFNKSSDLMISEPFNMLHQG